MLKKLITNAFLALILSAPTVGCGLTHDEKQESVVLEQHLVTPKQTCVGDNDMAPQNCFRGIWLNPSSNYQWRYVSGAGFYWNDARTTTYASNGYDAAKWTFRTTASGEVWFSVWIPSTNATARSVYYTMQCGTSPTVLKKIDQLYYSAQWVTLANMGNFISGTTCAVRVSKYLTYDEINKGGRTVSKMAIDGMKMTVY